MNTKKVFKRVNFLSEVNNKLLGDFHYENDIGFELATADLAVWQINNKPAHLLAKQNKITMQNIL